MLQTEFNVAMSVWPSEIKPDFAANETSVGLFQRELAQHSAPAGKQPDETPKSVPAPVVLIAQETKETNVPELPAVLAEVEDLTPFIVSADTVKPGNRLNNELKRTVFEKESSYAKNVSSPYNMSDEKRVARDEKQQTIRKLKGPGDAKVFPMNTAARYTMDKTFATLPAALQAKTAAADKAAQAPSRQKAIKPTAANQTVDVEKIKNEVSEGSFAYKRQDIPSVSNEKNSAAASYIPEVTTRQLDTYAAMERVAKQGLVDKKQSADLNV